jgi:hypothetical protein
LVKRTTADFGYDSFWAKFLLVMTPPYGLHLVCPLALLVNVEMTSEVPTPPLAIVDNDVVEALRFELAKCKLDHNGNRSWSAWNTQMKSKG